MRQKLLVPILAAAVLANGPVYAHHPFGTTYLEDQTTQIEGKLVSFLYRNPHSFIEVETRDEKGRIQLWTVEWAGASQLENQGIRSTTLRYGDVVTIMGNRGRVAEDHKIRLTSLRRKSDSLAWIGAR